MTVAAAASEPIRYGIGGSQAAAAVGLHPHCPPIQLWCELAGEAEPFEGNRFTKWGKLLEEPVRQEYAERNGVTVVVPPTRNLHWKRWSPDGIVYLGGADSPERGLEVKTGDTWTADRWGEENTDEIPIEYLCQGAWYMHLTNLPRWDYAVLLGGNDYREYVLYRDEDFERSLVAGVTEFWETHVVGSAPPDPDGSDEYRKWLARRFPHVSNDYREADDIAELMTEQLRDVVRDLKILEATKSKLTNSLLAKIGSASGLKTSLGKLTYRPVKGRKKTNWQAIGRELADRLDLTVEERLTITDKHTSSGKGYRSFRRPNAWTKDIAE